MTNYQQGLLKIPHWIGAHQRLLAGAASGAILALHWLSWKKDRDIAIKNSAVRSGSENEPVQLTSLHENVSQQSEPELVSVLIAVWNEEENIRTCIESVLGLRYPNKELVLCVGGLDRTSSIVHEFEKSTDTTRIVLLEQAAGEGKQRALRRCFEDAQGELIYLIDADCITDDRCFESLLQPILAGEEAVAGAWRPLNSQQYKPLVSFQWTHHAYRLLHLPKYTNCFNGVNALFRRSALEDSKAFEPDTPIGTDYIQSKQLIAAGYQIRAVPNSRIRTVYPERFGDYWRQQSRWFRTPLILGLKHQEWTLVSTQLRAGISSLLLLAIPLFGGLKSQAPRNLWLLAVAHLLIGQWRVTYFAKHAREIKELPASWIFLFPFYMIVSWVATARGILESLFSKRKWHW